MTAPADRTPGAQAESRELADYLADQDPLDAQAALWAARRQDGLSADEAAELESWLAGDPARGTRLAEFEGVLGQVDDLPRDDVSALRAAVAPRPAAAGRPARPDRRSWLFGRGGRGGWVPVLAAAGLASLLVGGGWMGWDHWQQQPTYTRSLATVRGQQTTAALPDGSRLRLDTATRLDVALYRQRREVKLSQGQAYFEVHSDAERPFHVLAGPLRISVLGTRFAVRYEHGGPEAGRVRVVVDEGRVRVTPDSGPGAAGASEPRNAGRAAPDGAVVLTAGQGVESDADGRIVALATAATSQARAWRDGRVVLDDTPLGDAVAEFERYVDTGLVIADPAVAALRLNGSFDLRQVQAFQRALPQTLPVRLRTRADGRIEVLAAPAKN